MAETAAASTATKLHTATIGRLLAEAKELHEQTAAKLAEIAAVLEGRPTIEKQVQEFKAGFDRAWCSRYAKGRTGAYLWTAKTDIPQIKRLLQAVGLEEAIARAGRFIRSEQPFYVGRRHGFLTFVASINEWAGPAEFTGELELSPPVADCKHKPTCKSDQEHTKRKLAEMRS